MIVVQGCGNSILLFGGGRAYAVALKAIICFAVVTCTAFLGISCTALAILQSVYIHNHFLFLLIMKEKRVHICLTI